MAKDIRFSPEFRERAVRMVQEQEAAQGAACLAQLALAQPAEARRKVRHLSRELLLEDVLARRLEMDARAALSA